MPKITKKVMRKQMIATIELELKSFYPLISQFLYSGAYWDYNKDTDLIQSIKDSNQYWERAFTYGLLILESEGV